MARLVRRRALEDGRFRILQGRCGESVGEPAMRTGSAIVTMRCLRLKVRAESYSWLNAAAVEVNQVFNWANETSLKAATRTDLKRKWMSGFDLCNLSAGAAEYFEHIGADIIQSICVHYAQKRRIAKR